MPDRVIRNTAEFRAQWSGALPVVQIAAIYGVHASTVSNAAKQFGLPNRKTMPDVSREQFFMLWVGDKTRAQIAAELDCTDWTLTRLAERFGLLERPKERAFARAAAEMAVVPVAAAPVRPLQSSFWTTARDNALRDAAGRYAAIAALAEDWGVTSGRLVSRWHQLRVTG